MNRPLWTKRGVGQTHRARLRAVEGWPVGGRVLLGPAEDVAVLRAGQAHGGGIHYGHQPLDVLHQHTVEEALIALLNPHQVDVSGNTGWIGQFPVIHLILSLPNGLEHAHTLQHKLHPSHFNTYTGSAEPQLLQVFTVIFT